MLCIRLQRIGRRNDPAYRVVVVEKTVGPKSNSYVERVGSYDPVRKTKTFEKERITYWISQGAQVSDTVHNLLVSEKVIEGKKINVLPKKRPIPKVEVSSKEGGVSDTAAGGVEVKEETTPEKPDNNKVEADETKETETVENASTPKQE